LRGGVALMAATDISQCTPQMIARARQIFDIAVPYMPRDPDVVLGVLTTANDESSLRVYGNDGTYAGEQKAVVWKWYGGQAEYRAHMRLTLDNDPDAVAGSAETTKDSVGLYQQREMYGYAGLGSSPHPDAPGRLMDVDYSTRVFIDGVPGQTGKVRSWLDPRVPTNLKTDPSLSQDDNDLRVAKRCQWVQGSEFPTGMNYLEALHCARQLIAHFGGLPDTRPTSSAADWLRILAAALT
jgi:hypothetical protein